MTGGLWGELQQLNADVIIEHCYRLDVEDRMDHELRPRRRTWQVARTTASSSWTPRCTSSSRRWRGSWDDADPMPRSRPATEIWCLASVPRRKPTATFTRASGARPARALQRPRVGPRAVLFRAPHPGCRGPTAHRPRRRAAGHRAAPRRPSRSTNSGRAAGRPSAGTRRSRWRSPSSAARHGDARYLELATLLVERRGHGQLKTTLYPGHEYFLDDIRCARRRCCAATRSARSTCRQAPSTSRRDGRRRAAGRRPDAVGEHGRSTHLHHGRHGSAPPERGVRRRLRAAGRPRVRRDVREHRLGDAELATAAAAPASRSTPT